MGGVCVAAVEVEYMEPVIAQEGTDKLMYI